MARPIPKLDRVGRPQHDPAKLFASIEGLNWLAERLLVVLVPGEYWTLDVRETGRTRIDATGKELPITEEVAVVACPCGHDCAVPVLEAPTQCEVEGCPCTRWFAFDSRDVWVFNSPADRAVVEADTETGVPA